MRKLFIDDLRDPVGDDWTVVRNSDDAIKAIYMFDWDVISLDHDIENFKWLSFTPVAHFICEKYWIKRERESFGVMRPLLGPKIVIHSINPAGAKKMQQLFRENGIKSEYIPYKANQTETHA